MGNVSVTYPEFIPRLIRWRHNFVAVQSLYLYLLRVNQSHYMPGVAQRVPES